MKNQKSFIFDLNRCTGCGACVIACATENMEKQTVNWRDIHTFNETHHPALPLFNLSMACNHCIDAACKKGCPASAYTKDKETGAVVHHADRCMGCTYCTWACPYDAPRYSGEKGVVEKCDFCVERLKNGEAPACICACPTNALRFGDYEEASEESRIIGFTDTGIRPAIRFKPLRKRQEVPETTAPPAESAVKALFDFSLRIPERKITLRAEWPLLLFTTIAYLLTAWFAAFFAYPSEINPFIFLGAGAIGMIATVTHLGRKTRFFRAIFNLKTSWLSREILFFSLFMGLSGLYLLFFPEIPNLGRAAVITGFIGLYSIDKIYQVAMQVGPLNFHSAHTFLNGLYLTGILTGNGIVFGLMGVIKLFLYLFRKVLFKRTGRNVRPLVSFIRISLGFLLPLAFFLLKTISTSTFYGYVIAGVILGEVIDRTEYYDELDIVTPRKQMLLDMERLLKEDSFGDRLPTPRGLF
jgi:Fe-S-cluster-containing dehydrogenase component